MDSYPNLNINVKDDSTYTPVITETLPLHRAIYAMKTEKGPIGEPKWCANYARAVELFGEKTFDRLNKNYFSRASVFLLNSFQNNGAFIVRVGNDTVLKASMVLQVQVPLTSAGSYVYSMRALTGDETITTLTRTAATVSAGAIYPLMAFEAITPGVYGNEYGIRLFSDLAVATYNEITKLDGFLYSFGFVKKDANADTFTRLSTKYSPYSFNFVAKEGAIDPDTKLVSDFDNVFERYYGVDFPAPINTHVYSANMEAVAQHAFDMFIDISSDNVKAALQTTVGEGEDAVTTDHPNRINIFKMEATLDSSLELQPAALGSVLVPCTVEGFESLSSKGHFLLAGSDGDTDLGGELLDANPDDTSYEAIENMIADFYTLDLNNKITDAPRYPFNTIFDTGYSSIVKDPIIAFLAIRDDVKIVMSTWNGAEGEQDEATANSVGDLMVGSIRLTPESEIFGTGCFRAIVFGQTGVLNGELYKKTMPFTVWYADKLARLHNLQYIAENPCGLPNANVDIFKTINWLPSNKIQKRSMWNACINYCQHYDMVNKHFAGLKSVYQYDTSVLSTDSFTNTVIYTKQLVRPVWAKYAGVEDVNLEATYAQIINDLSAKLAFMLNGKYKFATKMFQTEEEALMGYIHHINIDLTGGPSQRVWNVDIICKRTGFGGNTNG